MHSEKMKLLRKFQSGELRFCSYCGYYTKFGIKEKEKVPVLEGYNGCVHYLYLVAKENKDFDLAEEILKAVENRALSCNFIKKKIQEIKVSSLDLEIE